MGFRKGTGFTNVNKIIQANKGNRLGSSLSSGITNQVQDVQQNVQKAQDQFAQDAQANRLDTDEARQKRDTTIQKVTGWTSQPAPQNTGIVPPAQQPAQAQPAQSNVPAQAAGQAQVNAQGQTTQPANGPVSDAEIQDFTKFRTGTYTGPQELKDSTSLMGKAAQAEQLGGLARSTGGRQELLRRFVGGRNYTQGQRNLDETILSQDKDVNLGAAARETRGTMGDVERANQTAANLAQEYGNRAKLFGQETTQKLGEARNPISGQVDSRLKEYQDDEQYRLDSYKGIQDMLTSSDAQYEGLDKLTRAGLALDEAKRLGFLKDEDVGKLIGDDGLIARAQAIGLDTNALINERLKSVAAQGLTRSGAASEEERAKIAALDRLSGKVGADVEFGGNIDKYQAGSIGFDAASLDKYISKAESEKAYKDAKYAEQLAAQRARYLNQAMAGGMGAMQGGMQALSGVAGQMLMPLDPKSLIDPAAWEANTMNIAQGVANTAAGHQQMMNQGQNALLEGIAKLNIGGTSIANTEAGKQLLKAIALKSKLEAEAAAALSKAPGQISGAIKAAPGAILNAGEAYVDYAKTVGEQGLNVAKDMALEPTKLATGVGKSLLKDLSGVNLINSIRSGDPKEILATISGYNSIRDAGGKVIGSAKKIGKSVGNAVKSVGKSVGGALKKVCFAGGTKILMADGKYKNVEDLELGDELALGGKVITAGEGYSDDIYNYNGVKVSGAHAVFEDGKWIRVEDSSKAYPIGREGIVYPVATENHLMITKGQVWADLFEVEEIDGKSKEEILKELNNNSYRNNMLRKFEQEFFNENRKVSKK